MYFVFSAHASCATTHVPTIGSNVTGGCATSPLRYCPDSAVTRGQMAAFLVKTFSLQ